MTTRRAALHLITIGAGTALLAACAPAAQPSPTAPGQPTGSPTSLATNTTAGSSQSAAGSALTPAPTSGGTLRLAVSSDLTSLEGQLGIPPAIDTLWQVYDRLTEYDTQGQPQPRLAESWDLSSDYKQITLHLRKGVQYHSGRELTSADIQWNVLRAQDPKVGVGQLAPLAQWWTRIDTPDQYTVVLTSDQPRPGAFDFFEFFNILDSQTVQGSAAPQTPIGTGPFKFGEWVQGDHITFPKNPNYWMNGRPYLEELQVPVVRDQAAMIVQLQAKSVDAVDTPAIVDAVNLGNDPNYQLWKDAGTGAYALIAADAQQAPTDNKLVRQALNWSINRQRITDSIYHGINGGPKDLPWPPQSPAYDAAKDAYYTFDLDKAKSLFQQAGVSNLALDFILANGNSEQASIAQIVQSDLASIGVNVAIKPMDLAAWRATTASFKGWGLNVAQSAYAQLQPPTLPTMSAWWSYSASQTGFKDDQYTALVQSASVTTDAGQLKLQLSQLNDYLLDQSFVMVLCASPSLMLTNTNVHGLRFTRHQGVDWTNAWLG
ncbi:MAG: ABC transporter substrate-binding protein [Chloroflexi bacterium]|nr:ABC transporter substrate-binding protein [Chloroflexota bacterium]